jgi:hypothetical protein
MSNLIKKNLVEKANKLPARYSLTESGRQLAIKLIYGITNENEHKSSESSESDHEQRKEELAKEPFNWISAEHNQHPPLTRNKYMIKESETDLQSMRNEFIEIIDSDSDVISLNDDDNLPKKSTYGISQSKSFDNDDSDDLPDLNVECKPKNIQKSSWIRNNSSESTGLSQPMASTCITNSQHQSYSSAFTTSSKSNEFSISTLITKEPSTTTETSSNLNKISTPTALTTFSPGSFEVILFVDNCEQSHAKRQDLLIDELKKANIKFDTGKLSVGDFAWIARQKSGSELLNTAMVLDFIVERKRMDDLCQSIIDGRYKEQKVIFL